MPAPYDYSIQAQDPFASVLTGFQGGAAIRQAMDARQQAEAQREAAAQMNADLSAASKDPRMLPGVMVKYPQLAEKLKHGWDAMNSQQQQGHLSHITEVASALQVGESGIAVDLLKQHAQALRNSGDEQGAKATESMATLAEQHPERLLQMTQARIAALPGGDKVIEGMVKLGAERRAEAVAPAELSKKQSEAQEAAVKAKFAESVAVKDLEKKGWDIKKIQEDIEIAKKNSRIAAMNAEISREGNAIRREELQLRRDAAITERDDKVRAKVAEAETGAAAIDNVLNTVERIKKNPALNSVVGAIEGGRFYPQTLVGMLPGTASADERANAIALIETLGSQNFLAQVKQAGSMSGLTEKEGQKLQNALVNLGREQDEKQWGDNLAEVSRLMYKARDTLAKKTGVPLGAPDTPAVAPVKINNDADYNALPSGATFIAPDGTTRRKP